MDEPQEIKNFQFEIIPYDKPDGTLPAFEFLNELPKKLKAKTHREIFLLAEFGTEVRGEATKHLEDGIFEIRSKQSSDIARVLYFFMIGKKIVLTNGFIKKQQRTPRSEIELAKKYRAEYLSREENQ
ncbi:MAG: type II toxin-antitoxin system RelE/ParE family toxin [Eubacteriales bacterium]